MLKRFSTLFAVLLAVAMLASQADARLLLSARGPGGSNNVTINTGQDLELTIRLQATAAFVLYNGGDFLISSNSDSTFQQAFYDLNGAGAWTAVPPPGGTTRFFTGGPQGTHIFFNPGDTLQLGRIVLRGGPTAGTYTTGFSQVLQLDSAFLPIETATSGFTYTVVPEPSSAMLIGLAATGLAFRRRRS